ncbi:hypothetical protein IF1G_00552 [Cordyceps javanica]|uniref:Uncharacterized protein n=1 Tax=Cordyceps javanica TaxID=43265 RepID=A0A545VFZ1_9HYPO|nr:hypothetical protein IF1G_00552 [Cordyceps javanica]TQW11799.1 hypothetical protein IF2G_00530 [Cordyceps javanica]
MQPCRLEEGGATVSRPFVTGVPAAWLAGAKEWVVEMMCVTVHCRIIAHT